MIKISGDAFLAKITAGHIYLFKNDQLKKTTQPHYHIAMSTLARGEIIFFCCTTKWGGRIEYIQRAGLSYTTLVYIKPSGLNELPEKSYVNCNDHFEIGFGRFKTLYEEGKVKPCGVVEEHIFEQIKTGVKDSDEVVGEIQDIIEISAYGSSLYP
jgi:hypothetical protein